MEHTATPPELLALRERIDDLDAQLVALLAQRGQAVAEVTALKHERGMRVVDRGREDRMLERIGELAAAQGLDVRVARQVLRTVIDGFTLLEVEELGRD